MDLFLAIGPSTIWSQYDFLSELGVLNCGFRRGRSNYHIKVVTMSETIDPTNEICRIGTKSIKKVQKRKEKSRKKGNSISL